MGRTQWFGTVLGIVVFLLVVGILAAHVTITTDAGVVDATGRTSQLTEQSLLSYIFSGIGNMIVASIRALIPTSCGATGSTGGATGSW